MSLCVCVCYRISCARKGLVRTTPRIVLLETTKTVQQLTAILATQTLAHNKDTHKPE